MKIAIESFNPRSADIKTNKELVLHALRLASLQAELVVFPEAALCGCPLYDLFEDKELMRQNAQALKEIAQATKQTACILGYMDYLNKEPTTAAAFIYKGKITKIFDTETVELNGKTLQIVLGDLSCYKNLNKDADYLINVCAAPYRKRELTRRLQGLQKAAKKLGTPLIHCNLLGGGDGLLFDGLCSVHSSKGETLLTSEGFTSQQIVYDTEEKYKPVSFKLPELEELLRALTFGLKDFVTKCGIDKVIFGSSGGLDSAVVAVLAARAFGGESVYSISLPFRYTSEASKELAAQLAKNLKINFEEIPLKPIFDSLKESVLHISSHPKDLTEQNMQARIRANILMTLSSELNAMLIATGNKSEAAVGYCTIYGDTCGFILPLADIYKSDLYDLARYINKEEELIPQGIIDRAPSAELATGQKDQDSLPAYPVLDNIIRGYLEEHLAPADIAKKYKVKLPVVLEVLERINLSDFKRKQCAPIIQISEHCLGNMQRPIAKKINL